MEVFQLKSQSQSTLICVNLKIASYCSLICSTIHTKAAFSTTALIKIFSYFGSKKNEV